MGWKVEVKEIQKLKIKNSKKIANSRHKDDAASMETKSTSKLLNLFQTHNNKDKVTLNTLAQVIRGKA